MSNVRDMREMFAKSKFNGDISGWDVSKVRDVSEMFASSEFNGDISRWNVSKVRIIEDMFVGSRLEKEGEIPKWYKEMKSY